MKAENVQLTVSHPVPVEIKDSYIVEIQSMLGDGDVYRDFTVGPFKKSKDDDSLHSLLETLERMDEKFPRGMGGTDNYDDVLGYYEWFCEVRTLEAMNKYGPELIARDGADIHQEIMDLSKDHSSEWNMDSIVDCIRPEQLAQFNVFYYDEAGVKYAVQIDWKA